MKSKVSRELLALGLIGLLALAGCGGGGPAALDVTVQGLDTFKFDPATITAGVGQTVNVTLSNAGVLEHNFVLDEYDLHLGPIAGGQSSNGSFTPNAAGTFTYYCDVAGHREAGMTGTLTINP